MDYGLNTWIPVLVTLGILIWGLRLLSSILLAPEANPMAPTHRVLGRSPRGKLVECGGICKKQNQDNGSDYFTLTVRDHAFNANLGKAASQDDMSLQAIIPWGPKEAA